MTIYKSLIKSLLEYANVIYEQPSNASFSRKNISVQYNVGLAITRAIKGYSRENCTKVRTGIPLSKKMGEKIVLTL